MQVSGVCGKVCAPSKLTFHDPSNDENTWRVSGTGKRI